MEPGTIVKDKPRKRSKDRYDWSTSWNNSLKEIAGLLPISEPINGRGLTKKETLVHMLRYFDFLQSHIDSLQSRLPLHCLPEVNERESESESEDTPFSETSTPPPSLKAKRKHACGRPRKRTPLSTGVLADKKRRLHKEGPSINVIKIEEYHLPMWGGCCEWSEPQPAFIPETVYDSDSLPSSSDSTLSLRELLPMTATSNGGSSGDQVSPSQGLGGHCSVCEDRTGSEDGSPGSQVLDTPPTGSGVPLLKDRMLGVIPSFGKKEMPFSPCSTPQMPLLPLLPLLGAGESLNLSPSLLTSPARGLSHSLLPEGQEELQRESLLHSLFEDVWVTPKNTVPKASSLSCSHPNDSLSDWEVVARNGSGGYLSPQSEGEDGGFEDVTWTPKQRAPLKKASQARHRRGPGAKAHTGSHPSLKKKCVNGFIMFCRMNRKLYLRTHPGTPSTVVTKELANLWHFMPKQERRVYCLKARRFSRQQNRNVRSEGLEGEAEGEDCVPSPLHMLLAHRDLCVAARGGI